MHVTEFYRRNRIESIVYLVACEQVNRSRCHELRGSNRELDHRVYSTLQLQDDEYAYEAWETCQLINSVSLPCAKHIIVIKTL